MNSVVPCSSVETNLEEISHALKDAHAVCEKLSSVWMWRAQRYPPGAGGKGKWAWLSWEHKVSVMGGD